jgi:hypothetical protein
MKLDEFRNLINNPSLNPDLEIVMSKDGEGNQFSPFSEITIGLYEPINTWDGDFCHEKYMEIGETSNALCLWPVN